MLSTDFLFRRLPIGLALKQRLQHEAMVHSLDIAGVALDRLRMILGNLTPGDLEPRIRAMLFSDAWSIVDQLNALRQLINLERSGMIGPKTQALLAFCETARTMRNRMDHLAGGLDNLSQRKGAQSPLFGAISAFRSKQTDFQTVGSVARLHGEWVAVMAGAIIGNRRFAFARRELTMLPVGEIQLEAFDTVLELDSAVHAAEEWLVGTAEMFEASFEAAAQEHASAAGVDVKTVTAPHGNSMVIIMSGYKEFDLP